MNRAYDIIRFGIVPVNGKSPDLSPKDALRRGWTGTASECEWLF